MNILFSNPPWWESGENDSLRIGIRAGSRWPFTRPSCHAPGFFQFGGYLPFPFFLAAAASYTQRLLSNEGVPATVSIRDSIARGESYAQFAAYLRDETPDWLVIETATPSWAHDSRMIAALAKDAPGCKVIVTGTTDCALAAETLAAHPNIAAIVQGEYDKQIVKVIAGARGLVPHDLLTRGEMADAPFPMFDEACATHYWDGCPKGQRAPQLQLITSRGCPYKCVFCVWPAVMTGNDPDGTRARSVRSQPAGWVEGFIRHRLAAARVAGTPYQSIYLDDDTFNLTEKHTLAISAVMKRIGLPWSAMCRADTISREAWQAMKDAGCFGVKIGFESGSQYVIDKIINKRLDLVKAAETARWLRSIGMTVHGTFTIGLPGETHEQQQETLRFIQSLYDTGALDTHQLSGTAEIEGTPMHTLRTAGHLDKYEGAVMDEGYAPSADGQRKIENLMRRELA